MAQILPFSALRYDPQQVSPSLAVTQPYDKITAAMQKSYYAASPYNLVRILLGQREFDDGAVKNVYTRAREHFRQWREAGILREDSVPCVYAYAQRFRAPGSMLEQERLGFIALGHLEDYAAKVIFRHEQTLAKPKADRLDLLRATRAHFGQLFMLYEDSGEIERTLAAGITGKPDIDVTDEYGVVHRVWKISDPSLIDSVRSQMRDKKLIIADGHHRYETALTYRDERRAALHSNVARAPSPGTASASSEAPYEYAMMTFVNLNGSGVVILPTHRVVHGLPTFSASDFVAKSRSFFNVEELDSDIDAVCATMILHKTSGSGTALLAVMPDHTVMLTKPRPEAAEFLAKFSERQQALDVLQLHKVLLEGVLKLSEESIRNQENLSYFRDPAEALEKVRRGKANIAFLMNPCRVQQVRDVAFAGEVMPQKSTDFYPKLVSGLTIYALE